MNLPFRIPLVLLLGDGRIVCVNYRESRGATDGENANAGASELLILTKTPRSELPDKTVLTLASLTLDNGKLSDLIAQFNQTNPFYRIEVIDYGLDFRDEEQWRIAVTRLCTDIISGNIPDILDVSFVPFVEFAEKGLFTDLYPFIDADPELSREILVEGVFRADEIDGCLYRVFPDFGIQALGGKPEVLGEKPGWTMDEFMAVLNAHPEADMPLGQFMRKDIFMRWAVSAIISDYVDADTGEVSFDSPEFVRFLEFVNTLPDSYSLDDYVAIDEAVATGRQIIGQMLVDGFASFHWEKAVFGGRLVLKGYPNGNGTGCLLAVGGGLAITERCESKAGAWEFLRMLLDKDFQLGYNEENTSFMTNLEAFHQSAKNAMAADNSFLLEGGMFSKDFSFGELTLSDVDYILAVIDSAQRTTVLVDPSNAYSRDSLIYSIVNESASDYFAGMCTAQDAARVIQSRVEILVSERN